MSDHGAMKTWTPADWDRFNDPVVEAFRANSGRGLLEIFTGIATHPWTLPATFAPHLALCACGLVAQLVGPVRWPTRLLAVKWMALVLALAWFSVSVDQPFIYYQF